MKAILQTVTWQCLQEATQRTIGQFEATVLEIGAEEAQYWHASAAPCSAFGSVTSPDIGAGFKSDGFGLGCALPLEIVLEKGELDVGTKVVRSFGIEDYIAKMAAVAAGPAAVNPWSLDKCSGRFRVVLVNRVEGLVGAVEIFSVVPAAYNQHGALHIFHVVFKVAALPISVIGVVLSLVREEPVLAV